jgi:AraC family transcriptional regulator
MNKQSSEKFNNLIKYIEENLCNEISYKKLSQILGVNEYTMHRIFLFVTNYTLAEYIRKRRLSMSALDLIKGKEKIIDIAIKYNYESSQAFSRAFKNMMGFLPSQINTYKSNIKFFPQYELIDENLTEEFNYHLEKNIEFKLYTISMKTTIKNCHNEAPLFWKDNYNKIQGKSEYGVFEYDKECIIDEATYYIASKEKFDNSKLLELKRSNYLVFECEYINSSFLNEFCKKIYRIIIPSFGYELNDLPDIEEYLENKKLKLYIPIK